MDAEQRGLWRIAGPFESCRIDVFGNEREAPRGDFVRAAGFPAYLAVPKRKRHLSKQRHGRADILIASAATIRVEENRGPCGVIVIRRERRLVESGR